MEGSPHSIRPVLALQATGLTILTALVVGLVYSQRQNEQAEIQTPRETLRAVAAPVSDLMVAPYQYAATGERALSQEARQAQAQARAGLKTLGQLVDGVEEDSARALFRLGKFSNASNLVFNGGEDPDYTAAFEEISDSRSGVVVAMNKLHQQVEFRIAAVHTRNMNLLLGAWGLMLVVTLSTSLLARRRARKMEVDGPNAIKQALSGVSDALHAAVEGGEIPEVPEHPLVAPLRNVVLDTTKMMTELRAEGARAQRSSSFTRDLIESLDLHDDEKGVMSAALRTMRATYPAAGVELMVVNDETVTIEVHEGGTAACSLKKPDDCPMLRKGRTLHHSVGEGGLRCPHLTSDQAHVTCTPVYAHGWGFAIAQLSTLDARSPHANDTESLALALGSRVGMLRHEAAQLMEASVDPLTELPNRRIIDDRVGRLDAADLSYTLIMADIDHLSQINETHGEEAGDVCLQLFASVLRDACRDSDQPARVGGEEFAVLLPGAGMRAGMAVAMRIRAYLAYAVRRLETPFTVSVGVATRPDHGRAGETVLRAAEMAMLDAKEAGRDQVIPARVSSTLQGPASS